jgi:hypothetical protein
MIDLIAATILITEPPISHIGLNFRAFTLAILHFDRIIE